MRCNVYECIKQIPSELYNTPPDNSSVAFDILISLLYAGPTYIFQRTIISSLSSKTTFLSLMVLLRYRTIWVTKDFFTPKRFEPRPSFFSMSKYRNSRRDSKNFKFFSPQVFQIFDSKHGSPENYSDFLSSKTTFLSLMVLLRYRTIWVTKDFSTPKRFEPRPSFFSMSKYRNSRRESKNFKFFSPQVSQIFDSKHGSPENYSDFFFFLFFLFLSSKTTFLSLMVLLRYRTIWVTKDFFTPKRFDSRPSFFSM